MSLRSLEIQTRNRRALNTEIEGGQLADDN